MTGRGDEIGWIEVLELNSKFARLARRLGWSGKKAVTKRIAVDRARSWTTVDKRSSEGELRLRPLEYRECIDAFGLAAIEEVFRRGTAAEFDQALGEICAEQPDGRPGGTWRATPLQSAELGFPVPDGELDVGEFERRPDLVGIGLDAVHQGRPEDAWMILVEMLFGDTTEEVAQEGRPKTRVALVLKRVALCFEFSNPRIRAQPGSRLGYPDGQATVGNGVTLSPRGDATAPIWIVETSDEAALRSFDTYDGSPLFIVDRADPDDVVTVRVMLSAKDCGLRQPPDADAVEDETLSAAQKAVLQCLETKKAMDGGPYNRVVNHDDVVLESNIPNKDIE